MTQGGKLQLLFSFFCEHTISRIYKFPQFICAVENFAPEKFRVERTFFVNRFVSQWDLA